MTIVLLSCISHIDSSSFTSAHKLSSMIGGCPFSPATRCFLPILTITSRDFTLNETFSGIFNCVCVCVWMCVKKGQLTGLIQRVFIEISYLNFFKCLCPFVFFQIATIARIRIQFPLFAGLLVFFDDFGRRRRSRRFRCRPARAHVRMVF